MSDMALIPVEVLQTTVRDVFAAAGLSDGAARTMAQALVEADLRGIPSHGVLLLPMYVERLRRGSVTTVEQARVVTDLGAVAVLDADHALGALTGDQAMAMAVGKALQYGVGAVAVRHAFHFGGAFRYVLHAAERGLIGIAAANTRPLMPAHGGARAVVGNNPLAFGLPRDGEEPIVLDMALSEAALGKIRLAGQSGSTIPPTWATDAAGEPTTDPVAALQGLLLPMAGPKGYGLAIVVDALTGVLSGGAFGASVRGLYADTAAPNDCAHFFLALDPAPFAAGTGETFQQRLATLAGEVLAAPTASGTDRVYLPGQIEAERARAARRDGVRVDREVLAAVRRVAGGLGIPAAELDRVGGAADAV